MSYCIVKVKKFKSSAVKGIEIHDFRKMNNCNTNKDIDKSLSANNYDQHDKQNSNYNKFIKGRISELNLKKAVRKDAVAMVQIMVTSDHEYFKNISQEKRENFFKDSYEFLCKKYGQENVISSMVHLDETTPHMHFNFVPITEDNRLCAKDIINMNSLTDLQTEFYNEVGKKYDLIRGRTREQRLAEGDMHKNMSMPEFKAYTNQIQQFQDLLKPLRIEYEAIKGYVDQYKKSTEISNMYPKYVKRKKNIFGKEVVVVPKEKWEQRHISANEKSFMDKLRENFEKCIKNLGNEPFKANERYKKVKEKNELLNNKIYDLIKENSDLKVENKVYKKFEKDANNVIKNLSEKDIKLFDQYSKIVESKEKSKEKSNDDRNLR